MYDLCVSVLVSYVPLNFYSFSVSMSMSILVRRCVILTDYCNQVILLDLGFCSSSHKILFVMGGVIS